MPSVHDPSYAARVAGICARERIDVVLSLHDVELPILAAGRERIEAGGALLLLSRDEVVELCFDKLATREWALANGFDAPWTTTDVGLAERAVAAGELAFPLVVKPRWGLASIAVHTVESVEELAAAVTLVRHQLARSVLATASAPDMSRAVLIQERLPGTEFGIDVLNDLDGTVRSVYVKEKLSMRSGETEKACLRDRPDVAAVGRALGTRLAHVGNLDCDVFVDGDRVVPLELNPRFGGGYPFSHAAGADFPAAILAWRAGRDVDCDAFPRRHDVPFAKTVGLVEVDASRARS